MEVTDRKVQQEGLGLCKRCLAFIREPCDDVDANARIGDDVANGLDAFPVAASIDLSTGSEPLWSGMWKWGWNLLLATWAMISGVKRLGSMLLMRNRSAGTSLSRAWTKSKNDSPVDLPNDVHPGQYNLLGS